MEEVKQYTLKEEWKDISGYEGLYQISSFGNMKSISLYEDRLIKTKKTPKKLVPLKTPNGYLAINLRKDRIPRRYYIHRLVAINYIVNNQNKPFVNHKDGNKSNNDITNLEWCTAKENIDHAVKTGLRNTKGEHNVHSKLTSDDVINIRKMYENGNVNQIEIANIYNVRNTLISQIVRKEIWTHI